MTIMNSLCNAFKSSLRLQVRSCSNLASENVPAASVAVQKDYTPILDRTLEFPHHYQTPREVWVENLDSIEEEKRGLIAVHPNIFGVLPRIDIICQNVKWQKLYRYVSFAHTKVRSEVRGGGRKPWAQKGSGRARQGSIRAPHFVGGGQAHGPRSPKTHFYMLHKYKRIRGLTSVLSAKLAQDDLHIVDSLDIPSEDPQYLKDLVARRYWGLSVLFVDDTDIMPRNITAASDSLGHMNLMPVYGLNVFSMLKHETLVLTVDAVNRIEAQLLAHLNVLRYPDEKQLCL